MKFTLTKVEIDALLAFTPDDYARPNLCSVFVHPVNPEDVDPDWCGVIMPIKSRRDGGGS